MTTDRVLIQPLDEAVEIAFLQRRIALERKTLRSHRAIDVQRLARYARRLAEYVGEDQVLEAVAEIYRRERVARRQNAQSIEIHVARNHWTV